MNGFQTKRVRSFFLRLEITTLLLAAAILFAAVWITLDAFKRNFMEESLKDGEKFGIFLENKFQEARDALKVFTDLPETERTQTVVRLLSPFSDIYRLDRRLRLERIYKSVQGSQVFPGYSFARQDMARYIDSIAERDRLSGIIRSSEDDTPGIYYAIEKENALYLARLDFAYIETFLSRFSQQTGKPLLLLSKDGFVMAASNPDPGIFQMDLRNRENAPPFSGPINADGRNWMPLFFESNEIRTQFALLVPLNLFDALRNMLAWFMTGFMAGLAGIAVVKQRLLRRSIVQPITQIADRMAALEHGDFSDDDIARSQRFQELAAIWDRFQAMARAITARETDLRENQAKLQTVNRNLETEIAERMRAQAEQQRLIQELRETMGKVKQLEGILPICSFCKKIRDEDGCWRQLEEYIGNRSQARFTHGFCEACARKHYPEVFQSKENERLGSGRARADAIRMAPDETGGTTRR